MTSAPRVIAVDWSGRADAGQAESIWIAEVLDGRLVELRNGMNRSEVARHLVSAASRHDRLTVGLDFAFSMPAWWMRAEGFTEAADAWRMARSDGAAILRAKPPPFFGSAGSSAPPVERRYRRTEQAMRDAGLPAKSVFGLAGPGAVGVGSLRGMSHLLSLREAGFSVWPFDAPSGQRVLEVYPRAFTGPVDKGRWTERHRLLRARYADQDPTLLERAAGSQDAFDAAVSALVMGEHTDGLEALGRAADETERLEGRIWVPCAADGAYA